MQASIRTLCAIVGLALATVSCDGSDSEEGIDDEFSSEPTVQPGDTLDVGSTETVAVSGIYLIPDGATFITTRCVGQVSITIEAMPGNPVTNSCDGDGSSRQTNMVAGVTMVFYEVENGSFSLVTVT